MTDTISKIAAGLEQAFVTHGFAEPNIETLREAADVSLRTLYKYTPSRDIMVRVAMEHRHGRYMNLVCAEVPDGTAVALSTIIDRIAAWMRLEAARGCLFHAAVAAAPEDKVLRALLARHKSEVAKSVAKAAGMPEFEMEIALICDGLTQNWALYGNKAVLSAKNLCETLYAMHEINRPMVM